MPFVSNDGIRLHYEEEGQGAPLVMVHGLIRSLDMWRAFGFIQALKDDFRLILIDARGHGGSDKPHELSDYNPEILVADVLAVMNELGVTKADYMGFSLGAKIGWHIPRCAMNRFSSLILLGAAVYSRLTEAHLAFRASIEKSWGFAAAYGAEAALAAAEKASGKPTPPEMKARYLANDFTALLACLKASEEWPAAKDILPRITIPCLVIAGEADGCHADARQCVEHMPKAEFVSLPGVHHNPAEYRAELIIPYIKEFLVAVKRD
jgi:pimeloyl-ACP methyl ester carboxylesterase